MAGPRRRPDRHRGDAKKIWKAKKSFKGSSNFFVARTRWLTLCACASARLASRVPQRGFQPPPFIVPRGTFGLVFLLANVHLQLDGRGSLRMLFPTRPAPRDGRPKTIPSLPWTIFGWRAAFWLCMSSIKEPILAQSSFHSAHLPLEFDALVTRGEPHLYG